MDLSDELSPLLRRWSAEDARHVGQKDGELGPQREAERLEQRVAREDATAYIYMLCI